MKPDLKNCPVHTSHACVAGYLADSGFGDAESGTIINIRAKIASGNVHKEVSGSHINIGVCLVVEEVDIIGNRGGISGLDPEGGIR